MEGMTEKAQWDIILKIINFEKAVLEDDIEGRSKAEEELRKALRDIGLGEKLIEYLIRHFKRAAEIEKAYEKKCNLLHEVRETIRRLAEKV